MNCYNCDTLLESNWNYCPNCKRKLKKKKVKEEEFVSCEEVGKCRTCSCELNDKWNFCPICGTSVDFYSEKPKVTLPIIATNIDTKPVKIDEDALKKKEEQVNKIIKEEKKANSKWYNFLLFPNGPKIYVTSILLGMLLFHLIWERVITSPSWLSSDFLYYVFMGLIIYIPAILLVYAIICFLIGGFLLLFGKNDDGMTFLAFIAIIIYIFIWPALFFVISIF